MPQKQVYLDNNATTPLHPRVKAVINENLGLYGNASSFHELGRRTRQKIEKARENIASFIGAGPDEITFVGSGSEANNTILNIFSMNCGKSSLCFMNRREVVTSRIEHPCIMETTKCLQERDTTVKYVGVDQQGVLDLKELEKTVSKETGLVSVMLANNEIGTIQDIKAIAAVAHAQGAFMHTDAIQGLGKIDLNVRELDVDFLSLSAHKIYGPKGIGVIYTKEGTPFCPLIRGGHQEKGRRAGTENSLGILGMSEAVSALRDGMVQDTKRIVDLKTKLLAGIKDTIPDVMVNGHPEAVLPNTLNVSFLGAEGEAILLYLDLEGIMVSTGSACSSGSLDPSHVLLATGAEAELAHGSIRFSLGRETTEDDINYTLDRLPPVMKKIRSMSTAYTGGK